MGARRIGGRGGGISGCQRLDRDLPAPELAVQSKEKASTSWLLLENAGSAVVEPAARSCLVAPAGLRPWLPLRLGAVSKQKQEPVLQPVARWPALRASSCLGLAENGRCD